VSRLLHKGSARGNLEMKYTTTHTYVIIQVSSEAYREIRTKLEAAGYADQFLEGSHNGELINMHGLALAEHPGYCGAASNHEAKLCGATLVRCDECGRKWCLDHQTNPLVCPRCGDRPSAKLAAEAASRRVEFSSTDRGNPSSSISPSILQDAVRKVEALVQLAERQVEIDREAGRAGEQV